MTKIAVKVDGNNKVTKTAKQMPNGGLFIDSDGDLYLKVPEGVIGIEIDDNSEALLVPYTGNEMEDYKCFPYFERCRPENAELTLSIKYS